MGNVQGRATREHTIPGGLELQPAGSAGPTRENVSFDTATTQAEILTNDDAANETAEAQLWPESDVQLARFLLNLASASPASVPVFDPTTLGVLGGYVERVWIRPLSIAGLTVNPQISVGTNGVTFDNAIPQAVVSSVVGNALLIEPVAGSNLVYVTGAAILELAVRVAATATLYLVEVLVEGKIQRT